jgi:hypothetical protein
MVSYRANITVRSTYASPLGPACRTRNHQGGYSVDISPEYPKGSENLAEGFTPRWSWETEMENGILRNYVGRGLQFWARNPSSDESATCPKKK